MRWAILIEMRLLLLVVVLIGCLTPNLAAANPIPSGLFGLWAWGDWDDAFRLLSENRFQIAVGVSTKANLDLAYARGLKCIVDYGLTKEIASDEEKWKKYQYGLKKKVEELKNHPAVYAWYIVDEPEWQGISLDKVGTIVEIVRSIDNKNHPLFTVLADTEKWDKYIPYFDIIAVDPYLLVKNRDGQPDTIEKIRFYLRKIKASLRRQNSSKPVFVVLGAFEQKPRLPWVKPAFRKPTSAEMQEMVAIALDEGVDGLLIWTLSYRNNSQYHDWRLPDDPLWMTVRRIPQLIDAARKQ